MATEEYLPPESESSTEITEIQPSALSIITQSEYAAMVTTANLAANKRKIEEFSKKLMAYRNSFSACRDLHVLHSSTRRKTDNWTECKVCRGCSSMLEKQLHRMENSWQHR